MAFRIGQNVRAVLPEWANGFPMVIQGPPHTIGEVPEDSAYHGMDPNTVIQAVDAPVHPNKPGYYCAWPVAWMEADDGDKPVEWTEHLSSLCGLKSEEPAEA